MLGQTGFKFPGVDMGHPRMILGELGENWSRTMTSFFFISFGGTQFHAQ